MMRMLENLYDTQLAILGRLRDMQRDLDSIKSMLQTEEAEMAQQGIDLTGLTAQVHANTDLIDSVITILQAIPPSSDPATQAAIDQLKTELGTEDSKLAAAIPANTQPPAPSPAPEPSPAPSTP